MARKNRFQNQSFDTFLDAAEKAVTANMAPTATLVVNGKKYTKPQLLAQIALLRKPYDDVNKMHDALALLVQARDGAGANAAADFASGYAAGVQTALGKDPAVLTTYGVPPRKEARQLTPAEKVAKSAKGLRTRDMRGTLGAKAKAKIKAQGSFGVTTTPTGVDAPAPSPTPVLAPPSPAPVAGPPAAPIAQGPTNGAAPADLNGAAH